MVEVAFYFSAITLTIIVISVLILLITRPDKAKTLDTDEIAPDATYDVRIQKCTIAVGVTAGLTASILQIIIGSRDITTAPSTTIVTLATHLFSWAYLAVLTLLLIIAQRHNVIFRLVCHIALVSVFKFGLSLILCSDDIEPLVLVHKSAGWILSQTDVITGIVSTVGSLATLIAAVQVPKAPPLEYKDAPEIGVAYCTLAQHFWYSYTEKLQEKSRREKTLELGDLNALPAAWRPSVLLKNMMETRKKDWSLSRRLFHVFNAPLIVSCTLGFVLGLLANVPAFFLLQLLDFISQYHTENRARVSLASIYPGIGFVVGMLAIKQFSAFLQSQVHYISTCILHINVKAAVSLEIYDKTLRKQDTTGETPPKEIVKNDEESTAKDSDEEETKTSKQNIMNLMTIDADRITEICQWAYLLVRCPMELITSLVFLYKLVGWAALPGFAVICLFIPLTSRASNIYSRKQKQLMAARDKRVSQMNEILQSIRQIKFQSNEAYFKQKTKTIRDEELHHLTVSYAAYLIIDFCYVFAPIAITVVTFGTFAIFIRDLTPSIAFTSLVVVNQLRASIVVIPDVVVDLINAITSLKRVDEYLNSEELTSDVLDPTGTTNETQPVVLNNVTIEFNSSVATANAFKLRDISAVFPAGSLSLITGPTGGGKTLLLKGILGEAKVSKGSLGVTRAPGQSSSDIKFIPPERWILPNTFAYVAQSPWLENKSIQDNILFGAPMVQERYAETLTVCGLDADLAVLEDADQTEIGEKGINLSGGQKARVALARAVYSRASTVIMDDVLSALDAHISKHVFDTCINGRIMAGRTRILVTHQVTLCLEKAEYVLALDEGTTRHVGDVAALQRSGSLQNLASEVQQDNARLEQDAKAEEVLEPEVKEVKEKKQKPAKKLVDEETKFKGNVGFACYLRYMRSQGHLSFAVLIFCSIVLMHFFNLFGTYWLRAWSAAQGNIDEQMLAVSIQTLQLTMKSQTMPAATTTVEHSLSYWIGLYMAISLIGQTIGLLSLALTFWGTVYAGRNIYERLLDTVMRAPLRFFDTVPTGRLLNRFSKDAESIDSDIGRAFNHATDSFIQLVFIIVICVTVQPIFLVAAAVLIAVGLWFGIQYVSATRALKRLNSVNRSPMYETFSVTLSGITTIRAYDSSARFLEGMYDKVGNLSNTTFYNMTVNRWLSMRFDTVGNLYTAGMAAFILFRIDSIDAGLAGFTLSFALELQDALIWSIRNFAILEQTMNSVERVFEYTDIDTEAAYESEKGKAPPAAWPTEGTIRFNELELKYAPDLPSVLHKISFEIRSHEKIGIIGRTGSGKTTITLALFRFLEATHGSISIDGIDISQIGLHDLRSRLTIVPQEPTLFQGTLRSNLSEDASDQELRDVLRRVHLVGESDGETVALELTNNQNINVFENLDTPVTESGNNFSAGQRQLLCLARALLRRTKIIVMDEATASVSTEIDALIQKTIRSEFVDSTVLTIAHRLDTIIDYDRILVLGEGKVLEFDTPAKLLEQSESQFSQMVKAAKLKL